MNLRVSADMADMQRWWPGHVVVPLLSGLAAGMFCVSSMALFARLVHPSPALSEAILVALVLAVCLGIWFPNRHARRLIEDRGRRQVPRRGREADPDDLFTDAQLKTIGSACLVTSGLAMMGAVALAPALGRTYQRVLAEFHWTHLTLHILDLALAVVYVAGPGILLGMGLNCTQRVALLRARRLLLVPASLCAGIALSLLWWSVHGERGAGLCVVGGGVMLLLAGLAKLPSGGRPVLPSGGVIDLPGISDRWQFALALVPAAAGFLVTFQLQVWEWFFTAGPGPGSTAVQFVGLSLGLVLSTFVLSQQLRSVHGVAVLCGCISAAVCAVVVLMARLGCQPARAGAGWYGVTAVPMVLMGWALGAGIAARVHRGSRPATGLLGTMVAVGLGSAVCCGAAMVDFSSKSSTYHLLVLLALVWLAIGSLLLIHEPHFGLQRRWPQACLMMAMLVGMTIVLPRLAPSWSRIERTSGVPDGQLTMIDEPFAAARELAQAVREASELPTEIEEARRVYRAAAHTEWRRQSLDSMLRELWITKQKSSAIIVRLSAEQDPRSSERLRAALIEAAADKLRPDGALLATFAPARTAAAHVHAWQQEARGRFSDIHTFGSLDPSASYISGPRGILARRAAASHHSRVR